MIFASTAHPSWVDQILNHLLVICFFWVLGRNFTVASWAGCSRNVNKWEFFYPSWIGILGIQTFIILMQVGGPRMILSFWRDNVTILFTVSQLFEMVELSGHDKPLLESQWRKGRWGHRILRMFVLCYKLLSSFSVLGRQSERAWNQETGTQNSCCLCQNNHFSINGGSVLFFWRGAIVSYCLHL